MDFTIKCLIISIINNLLISIKMSMLPNIIQINNFNNKYYHALSYVSILFLFYYLSLLKLILLDIFDNLLYNLYKILIITFAVLYDFALLSFILIFIFIVHEKHINKLISRFCPDH